MYSSGVRLLSRYERLMHIGSLGFKLHYHNSNVYLCSGIQRGRFWKERGKKEAQGLA